MILVGPGNRAKKKTITIAVESKPPIIKNLKVKRNDFKTSPKQLKKEKRAMQDFSAKNRAKRNAKKNEQRDIDSSRQDNDSGEYDAFKEEWTDD